MPDLNNNNKYLPKAQHYEDENSADEVNESTEMLDDDNPKTEIGRNVNMRKRM